MGGWWNLNNYFRLHVCLSFRTYVRLSVRTSHFYFFRFPAVVSQNVINKSCLACVKSKKYASWVTIRPQVGLLLPRRSRGAYNRFQNHMIRVSDAKSDCSRRGEAEVRILNFKTTWSEFHNLSRFGPKQLCASAHLGCTREAGTS